MLKVFINYSLLALGSIILSLFGCSSDGVSAKTYAIGDTGPAGGFIFYDQGSISNGWRYLEAAPSDQSAGIQWGSLGTLIGGTTNDGKANTDAIVAALGAGTAAYLCRNLSLGGFSDWYLPSQDELDKLFINISIHGIGGIPANVDYWTSKEINTNNAYRGHWVGIGNAFSGTAKNDASIAVRAIRRFAP